MKKEEMNDINQYLIPKLEKIKIDLTHCKIDVTTNKTGKRRGDLWISLENQSNIKKFEDNIVALIEAKHKNSVVGDKDWQDAMSHGKDKSIQQGLNYYVVTNCISDFRYYNSITDDEISLDGKIITTPLPTNILKKIKTQVSENNSYVNHKTPSESKAIYEHKFIKILKKLANIYRSAGLKSGDSRIDPTISFVIIKYISEKENEKRELSKEIKLWDDLREISEKDGDLKAEFKTIVDQIWGDDSEYNNNIYKDFKNLINFPKKLKNEHYKKIYVELDNKYYFHGASFDLFGVIYEEFATQTKKKEFGEFYTRRHITNMVSTLLLRNELNPRELCICDPACGSGGFLTESYKTLVNNYSSVGKLTDEAKSKLQKKVFWAYDNDEKSVARTKINMFLVGDGHVNIHEITDSLMGWDKKLKWKENTFDYIIANPPMGKYDGEAKIENYEFTNESRCELLFTEKIIKATKYSGEIAIVINDGALEAPSRERFRKKLLENCNINAIISLSKYAFAPYTKEKTYILFMQRKNEEDIGKIQKSPIWNYILDYDGYANSDKRFRTKYHDDLPELMDLFNEAMKLLNNYPNNKDVVNNFKRSINDREKDEGLYGMKHDFVEIEKINKENYFNLLSEFHLRNMEIEKFSIEDADKKFEDIIFELKEVLDDYKNS
jgi:type I restriction-modification system DNA methylase subunit